MENNQETQVNPAVAYIKGRVQQLLEDAGAITKKAIETQERMQELVASVVKAKASNAELKAADVKTSLADIQLSHYNASLLDTEMRRIVTILGEDYTILKAVSETGDMPEEVKTILENYTVAAKAIYIIEKGVPRIAEDAVRDLVNKKIEDTTSNEEELERFFNGPNFQAK